MANLNTSREIAAKPRHKERLDTEEAGIVECLNSE